MKRSEKIAYYDNKIFSYSNKYFKNFYIISNSTFNKNHFAGTNLLINFIKNSKLKSFKFILMINTLKFYLKNISYFLIFIFILIINLSFKKKKKFIKNRENSIILIDTFIKDSSNYINSDKLIIKDNYFENLYFFLDKKKINYNLFIKFNDLNSNPLKIITLLKKLNNHNNVFTLYDFINFFTLIEILKFILIYPFSVYGVINNLGSDYFDNLTKFDLSENLHKNTFHNYLYLLAAKNSNKLVKHNKVNLISWFENLPCNLNFYLGFRIYNKKTLINGCNYLLKYSECRWHYLDERLSNFNIHPDKIFVTGKRYLKKNDFINYIIGPAFRYKYLNQMSVNNSTSFNKNILIALPYNVNDWQNLIDIIYVSKLHKTYNLFIKIHPDFYQSFSNFKTKIKFPYNNINTNLTFDYIISNSSGLVMEMAVLGTSVMILQNSNDFLTCHPMPEIGKGIIWDIVENSDGFNLSFKKLEENRNNNFENIVALSKLYFNDYFNKYKENDIINNYNLDEY